MSENDPSTLKKERARARAAAWRKANLERARAREAPYRKLHREEMRAYAKAYYAANPDRQIPYREAHRQEAKKRAEAWARANPERQKARAKAYREARRTELAAKQRARHAANPDQQRNGKLKKAYGITLDEFCALLERQGGCCAICGAKSPGGHGRYHVDHRHETGKIRGLLCHPCNVGLGHFKDDPQLLLKAVAYLKEDRKKGLDNTDPVQAADAVSRVSRSDGEVGVHSRASQSRKNGRSGQ